MVSHERVADHWPCPCCPCPSLPHPHSNINNNNSADMFATKFEADCMSKEAGMAYRKQVLAVGGTGSIMDHLTTFLGRPPQQTAFLKSRGMMA